MSIVPRPIKVLAVDDHALLREGIAALVRAECDMELVAEASNGREAIRRELKPSKPYWFPKFVVADRRSRQPFDISDARVIPLRSTLKIDAISFHVAR
jgi:CheY-like chemotaxis protein